MIVLREVYYQYPDIRRVRQTLNNEVPASATDLAHFIAAVYISRGRYGRRSAARRNWATTWYQYPMTMIRDCPTDQRRRRDAPG